MGRSRRTAIVAIAIAGLVLVAGVTYLASTLVSQPIGLTSEPATLGESLAPAPSSQPSSSTTTVKPVTTTVTTTVPATTTVTTPPATVTTPPSDDDDDHGGRDHDEDD